MKRIRTDKRLAKIKAVIQTRQPSLKIIIENIHDPHNVSAIFRTCDAAGISSVSLIYNNEPYPKIGKRSSASAFKWVQRERYNDVNACYQKYKADGFKIFASAINKESKNIFELDLTEKTALVFGNEHRGLSEEAILRADSTFQIPMYGMVQSLNVSVSAAITIYEALRQRTLKGMYSKSELSKEDQKLLLNEWIEK